MYKIELNLERMQIYVKAFDGAIKLISQQLLQNNSALALKQFLPDLISINKELQYLDKLIDETDRNKKEEINSSTNVAGGV